MKPAAKVGDLCLHAGKVLTGSPDTTTNDKKSARLGDIHDCKSHPPGAPPWPPGPIVTGSSTVFINRLKAARHTDKLMCGAPGPPPPGAANPKTVEYDVRPDDKYQTLMENEHEIQERDKVKDVDEAGKADIGETDDPLGIKEAKVPNKPKPHKSLPSGQGVRYKDGGRTSHSLRGNPYTGSQQRQGQRNFQRNQLISEVQKPKVVAEVPLGDKSAAVVAGPKKEGAPLVSTSKKKMKDKYGKRTRYTITLNLGFHLELSVGTRTVVPFAGVPMDTIVFIPGTVWIG